MLAGEMAMYVEELMSSAKCCGESDSVLRCAKLMRDENIGFVPVCNDAGEPVGAVTDRDLTIRVLAEGRSTDEEISRFMTPDVVSVEIGDDLRDAERLMRDHRKSRIMVVNDDGKLVGVISLSDVADVEGEQRAGETLQDVKSDRPTAH